MRRLVWFGLAGLMALASGCGKSPAPGAGCGPESCPGCCSDEGECLAGDESAHCGAGGVACLDCSAYGACLVGVCVPFATDGGSTQDGGPADAGGDASADAGPEIDGGQDDASLDAGGPDASANDAGPADAGEPDGSAIDAGETDAGEPDASSSDAGEADASIEDAGVMDAGADAGERDAGPAGESCANPITLAIQTAASATGTTLAMGDDSQGSCGGAGAADLVYAIALGSTADLRVQVTTTEPSFQPVVYLRGAGCTAELACAAAPVPGGEAYFQLHGLAAGSYFVWIDGVSGSEGSYALEMLASPPVQGDDCSAPLPLDLTSGSAQALGDTRSAANDTAASCGGASGKDRVYSFTLANQASVRAEATPNTASFLPIVSLRAATCEGSELACEQAISAGIGVALTAADLAPGDYFLWIDSGDVMGGSFVLDVTASP